MQSPLLFKEVGSLVPLQGYTLHADEELEPGKEFTPLGHDLQKVAPEISEYVPAGHSRQPDASCEKFGLYLPGAHLNASGGEQRTIFELFGSCIVI